MLDSHMVLFLTPLVSRTYVTDYHLVHADVVSISKTSCSFRNTYHDCRTDLKKLEQVHFQRPVRIAPYFCGEIHEMCFGRRYQRIERGEARDHDRRNHFSPKGRSDGAIILNIRSVHDAPEREHTTRHSGSSNADRHTITALSMFPPRLFRPLFSIRYVDDRNHPRQQRLLSPNW